ncbi:SusC/RagA family TonB-linked outer membrane protein [Salinibacter sp.]|uniref:SusC/RagA family TonB-linked outer membrane protein n=1 Tax=Salinibacter sp. TaxID=2065818 RepID=UPI002FC34D7E
MSKLIPITRRRPTEHIFQLIPYNLIRKSASLLVVLLVFGLALGAEVQAQQGTVTGTVVDSTNGEPLPGVNVVVQGTQQGTTTGGEGEYSFSVQPGSNVLEVSFVGYASKTREVQVDAGETVTADFSLSPSDVALDNVVVTALGVEREERSLSYSRQSVEGADLQQARELNVGNSLAGRVSGLQVNRAGTGVGGDVRMIIRGNRSISGSSQPLFVVDGVPIRGDISDINPDNIQDVEVLKGPNAAALYGNEAQNGAVVITTETAGPGTQRFSFTQNVTARDPIITTNYQNQYGQGLGGEYVPSAETSFGPEMNGQTVEHWSPAPEMQGETYSFTPQPNNVSDVFQTGINSSTNLKARLGGESIQGIFSYTLTEARGTVPENALQKHNFQVRVTGQPTDNLSMDGKLNYVNETIDNQLPTGENFANPMRHALRMPRNIRTSHVSNFEYTNQEGLLRQNFWNPGSNGGANPYWTINRNLNEQTKDRVIGLASATYDFTDNLNLQVRASADIANNRSWTKRYNDTYIIAQFGQFSEDRNYSTRWDGDAILSYARDVYDNWSLDATLGGSVTQERGGFVGAGTGTALTVPNFFSLGNTQNVQVGEGEGSPRDVQSVFGRGEIGWNDAVFLNFTGRNDWSSTLPPDNWSFFYPSVGLSAVLTDLVTFPEFVNFLRVRGSWARVGNEASPFQTVRTASFFAGGSNGFLELSSTLPADDLVPEETESWEFGTQIRTLNERLELNATVYHSETRNQLFTLQLPVASGASNVFTNGGNVRNRGIELTLTGTPVRAEDFEWRTTVNFSHNQSLVKEIHPQRSRVPVGGSFLGTNFIQEGRPFGQYFSRGFERDDQGRVIVGDDGIPELTSGETVKVADFNPDWKGGFSSTVSYQNLSLSFLIDHRQGGTVGSLTNAILAADGSLERTLDGRGGGLVFGENVFPDEEAVAADGSSDIPSTTAENFWRTLGGRNTPVGEAFSASATATKLREVTLSYSLPQSVLGTLPVNAVNVSVVGRNLFWLYRASSRIDPDILTSTGKGARGFESFQPPTTRTFGMNLNIQF